MKSITQSPPRNMLFLILLIQMSSLPQSLMMMSDEVSPVAESSPLHYKDRLSTKYGLNFGRKAAH